MEQKLEAREKLHIDCFSTLDTIHLKLNLHPADFLEAKGSKGMHQVCIENQHKLYNSYNIEPDRRHVSIHRC